MAVSVNQYNGPQYSQDPMDRIIKGLQIAGGVFGIKEGLDKSAALQAQTDIAKQGEARLQTTFDQQQAANRVALDPSNPQALLMRSQLEKNGALPALQPGEKNQYTAGALEGTFGKPQDFAFKQAETTNFGATTKKSLAEAGKFQAETGKIISETAANGGLDPAKQVALAQFGKDMSDPGVRSALGAANQQVWAAENIKTLTNRLGLPKGQMANPNESEAQRVFRYDHADTRQVAEIVKSMDRMLSQSAPTESGQEHLTPVTTEGLIQKYGERAFNAPRGANQGLFIERMMDTVDAEHAQNLTRRQNIISGVRAGHPTLEMNPVARAAMDQIVQHATQSPFAAAQYAQAPAGKAQSVGHSDQVRTENKGIGDYLKSMFSSPGGNAEAQAAPNQSNVQSKAQQILMQRQGMRAKLPGQ